MTIRIPLVTLVLLALCTALPALRGTAPAAFAVQAAPAPQEIPSAERDRANPVAADKASLARGQQLFGNQCAMCHGKTGDGKGDLAPRLKVTLPDLTDPSTQKSRTDGELFWILTNGHGRMTGQGDRLSEELRWDLVNYIRTFAEPKE